MAADIFAHDLHTEKNVYGLLRRILAHRLAVIAGAPVRRVLLAQELLQRRQQTLGDDVFTDADDGSEERPFDNLQDRREREEDRENSSDSRFTDEEDDEAAEPFEKGVHGWVLAEGSKVGLGLLVARVSKKGPHAHAHYKYISK